MENSIQTNYKNNRNQVYFIILLFFLTSLLILTRPWFLKTGIRWLYILTFSFSISFFITPLLIKLSFRFKALDCPDQRKIHQSPTPLLGGIGICAAFIISIMFNFLFRRDLLSILIGASVLVVIGIIDDIKGVKASIRLIVQIIVVLFMIKNNIVLTIFPRYLPGGKILNALTTILWVVGIINAMNFFDGMDGLAAGITVINAIFIGIVAFQTHQPYLGWLSIALIGGCLGFLPYNFRPGKSAAIFLGDGGSTFLGFTIATLAVMGDWATNDPIKSFSVPLLILSVLIFDMTYISISRITSHKVTNFKSWIEYVGQDHLHHRLKHLGFSTKQSVLFIYLLNVCLGIGAIVLRNARTIDALLLLMQAFIIFIIIVLLDKVSKKKELQYITEPEDNQDRRKTNQKLAMLIDELIEEGYIKKIIRDGREVEIKDIIRRKI